MEEFGEEYLEIYAGTSLRDRAARITYVVGNGLVCTTKRLRDKFRAKKISKKVIRKIKTDPNPHLEETRIWDYATVKGAIWMAKKQGRRILFTDEITITDTSMQTHAWDLKG